MSLTKAEEAAIAAIVSREIRPELRRLFDRVDDVHAYQAGLIARLDHATTTETTWRKEMRSQTQALLTAVGALATSFADYSSQVDAKLAAIQTAHDADDDEGVAKALAVLGTLKDKINTHLSALTPKADAVAALAPTMPETPFPAGNIAGTANPASADPAVAPHNPAAVPGDSLGAQAVGSASTDGKVVEGQTIDNATGTAAPVPGAPIALPADAATGEPAADKAAPAA